MKNYTDPEHVNALSRLAIDINTQRFGDTMSGERIARLIAARIPRTALPPERLVIRTNKLREQMRRGGGA